MVHVVYLFGHDWCTWLELQAVWQTTWEKWWNTWTGWHHVRLLKQDTVKLGLIQSNLNTCKDIIALTNISIHIQFSLYLWLSKCIMTFCPLSPGNLRAGKELALPWADDIHWMAHHAPWDAPPPAPNYRPCLLCHLFPIPHSHHFPHHNTHAPLPSLSSLLPALCSFSHGLTFPVSWRSRVAV